MNETYNTGSFDYTILKVYSTISKSFATELVDEEYIQPVMNQLNLYRGIYDENGNEEAFCLLCFFERTSPVRASLMIG